jgi:hypothetical protein
MGCSISKDASLAPVLPSSSQLGLAQPDRTDSHQALSRPHGSPPAASVAQLCYADALHCIFAFLQLSDTGPVMATCCAWLAAARSERSRELSVQCNSNAGLERISNFVLRRHVGELCFRRADWSHWVPAMDLVHTQLSHLTSLCMNNVQDISKWLPILSQGFGPDLLKLEIEPTVELVCRESIAALQPLWNLIPLSPRLHTLRLYVWMQSYVMEEEDEEDRIHVPLDLPFLLRLPALTSFSCSMAAAVSTQLINTFTLIPQLRRLKCFGFWTPDLLLRLCSAPQMATLEDVELHATSVTADGITHLSRLPALTSLKSRSIDISAYPLLQHLRALQSLHLCCAYSTAAAELAAMPASLQSISHLSSLSLTFKGPPSELLEQYRQSQPDHAPLLQELMIVLPTLKSLKLDGACITSVGFLRSLQLLQSLQLLYCSGLNNAAVLSLVDVAPRLVSLKLIHWRVLLTVEQLRRCRELLPTLAEFSYYFNE